MAQLTPPPSPPTQPTPPPPPVAMDGPAPGVRFASPVARVVGYLIDGFVAGLITWAFVLVFGTIAGIAGANDLNVLAGGSAIVMVLAVLAVAFLYFPYFWQKSGQTPGMRVMRIKVVRDADGGPISWTTGIVRLFGFFVSSFVLYIGFIWVLIDKRRRGWFDLMAGTCVVEA